MQVGKTSLLTLLQADLKELWRDSKNILILAGSTRASYG
jgi:hypothetical protein